jgi:hypothetical protein
MGFALLLAAAVVGAPSGAEPARAGHGSETFWGGSERAGSAETWMRRQPAPVNPRALPPLRRMRKGTISLGGQLGYGFVRGSSELNDHYDSGPSYAFRFRYMMSRRSALGFSFENHRYNTRAGLPPTPPPFAAADSHVVVTTVGTELVMYIHRERETNPYLVAGLGFASPNVIYERKESRRVDEGPFLTVGLGLERFLRPRLSFDVALRGYGEVGNSELSLFSQVNVGLHLYPGD